MKQVRFEESEVPYQTLARFGLTQEKIEDLPMWALEDIGQGRRSPLLPIQVNNDEGETLKSRTRFALVRMEDGKVDVVFYPQLEKSPLEAFTQEQQEDLLLLPSASLTSARVSLPMLRMLMAGAARLSCRLTRRPIR